MSSRGWHLISMTGIGHARLARDDITMDIVIKSVNQRGLEIKYRLPDDADYLEDHLKAMLHESLRRGRVMVAIALEHQGEDRSQLIFDEAKILHLINEFTKLNDRFPQILPASMGDIFSVPGLIKFNNRVFHEDQIRSLSSAVMKNALSDLHAAKIREGTALAEAIGTIFGHCESLIESIDRSQHHDVEKRFERFQARVTQLLKGYEINKDRLYQEFALLVERSDFQEEIDRLKAHIKHFDTICKTDESKGRKLDFLCQEMLRESNTLMSKASDSVITMNTILLKAEIERIREQVQNIE